MSTTTWNVSQMTKKNEKINRSQNIWTHFQIAFILFILVDPDSFLLFSSLVLFLLIRIVFPSAIDSISFHEMFHFECINYLSKSRHYSIRRVYTMSDILKFGGKMKMKFYDEWKLNPKLPIKMSVRKCCRGWHTFFQINLKYGSFWADLNSLNTHTPYKV